MEACKEVINSISAYKFQVKQYKSFTMLRDLEFFYLQGRMRGKVRESKGTGQK